MDRVAGALARSRVAELATLGADGVGSVIRESIVDGATVDVVVGGESGAIGPASEAITMHRA
jgi:hypothetical protein